MTLQVDLRYWAALAAAFVTLESIPLALADPPADRYELLPDTVKDLKTGLTWQRRTDCKSYNWSDAKAYCQSLGPGWRLPGLKELLTLVDPTRVEPAIDVNAFPNPSPGYWTAAPDLNENNVAPGAWVVEFDSGRASSSNVNYGLGVRCVR